MILQDEHSKKYDEQYMDVEDEWYRSCQINDLKTIFTNWTSGNRKIDEFVQEIQSRINFLIHKSDDIIFEWIPYNQFDNIKEVGKGYFATIYSAVWKNGPLVYYKMKWTRESNKKIALKHFDNSRNMIDGFLYGKFKLI